MLNLDGFALKMDGVEFSYDVAAPFGPKGGPAFMKVKARPAAAVNIDFKSSVEELLHEARVRDMTVQTKYDSDKDIDSFVRSREENQKWVNRAMIEIQYDYCIMSWESNIQNEGKDIEPTRENFLALSEFAHPEMAKLFLLIRNDITNMNHFRQKAEESALEQEAKN